MPATEYIGKTKTEVTKTSFKTPVPGFYTLRFAEGTKVTLPKEDSKTGKAGISFVFEVDGGDFEGAKVYQYISESSPKDGKDTANMVQFFKLIDASGEMLPFIKMCQAKGINPDDPIADKDVIANVVNIINTRCIGKVFDAILDVDESQAKDKDTGALKVKDDGSPQMNHNFKLAQFTAYNAGILGGTKKVTPATASGTAVEEEEV